MITATQHAKFFALDKVASPEIDSSDIAEVLRLYRKLLHKDRIDTRGYRVVQIYGSTGLHSTRVYIDDLWVGELSHEVVGRTRKIVARVFDDSNSTKSINIRSVVKFMLAQFLPPDYETLISGLKFPLRMALDDAIRRHQKLCALAASRVDVFGLVYKYLYKSNMFDEAKAKEIFDPLISSNYFYNYDMIEKYNERFDSSHGWYVYVFGQGERSLVLNPEQKTIMRTDGDLAELLPPEVLLNLRTLQVTNTTHYDSGVVLTREHNEFFDEGMQQTVYFIPV